MKYSPREGDLPREEIAKMAEDAIGSSNKIWVYFKFTCEHCGARVTFNEKNTLYEEGECCVCGKKTTVMFAGFNLHIDFNHGNS